MYKDNEFYGHAAILRRFAEKNHFFLIPGILQHGWSRGPFFTNNRLNASITKYMWSERSLRELKELNIHDKAVPIGAPYLYLQPEEPSKEEGDSSLLYFPFHGWEGFDSDKTASELRDDLLQLRKEGFNPISVCLYWWEYLQNDYVETLRQAGFDVVTAGKRDGDPLYLTKQRRLIRAHRYCASDRLCTALLYSLQEGRSCFLFPRPKHNESCVLGRHRPNFNIEEISWPKVSTKDWKEFASLELGLASKRSKAELLDIFDWSITKLYRWPRHIAVKSLISLATKAEQCLKF